MNQWKVIGISGITCGGKTTLSNHLLREFEGSVLVCQDDFFHDKDSNRHVMIPELNHQNWECLESIDWDSMLARIREVTTQKPPGPNSLLLVEGHIIYNYPPLAKLCDIKYFFHLTKEQCSKRRKARAYDPPDPPGYFDLGIWPMYCKNKAAVENAGYNHVRYLDGSESEEQIKEHVTMQLRKFLLS